MTEPIVVSFSCGHPKSEDNTYRRPDGASWVECLVCRRKRAVESIHRNRGKKAAFIKEYKTTRGCADCGSDGSAEPDEWNQLELHHLDKAVKTYNGSGKATSWVNLSWPKLRAELAVCAVLCVSCHKARHQEGVVLSG